MQKTFTTSIGPGTEFLYGSRAKIPLAFGCASLMRLPLQSSRHTLLAEALERGIRPLGVTRMYRLGVVENELGRSSAGRDQVGIATKLGIAVEPVS